jgi:hypothetical protein
MGNGWEGKGQAGWASARIWLKADRENRKTLFYFQNLFIVCKFI